ncbi:hypothetical protein C6497_11740 [Candidatus Poribacteria bacterium]|nr:MAG: hypothetical protein C6497_11740 [Candidatus Poribacteria bacterium]
MLKNPSRTLFYFFTQIRKLAINIGGYLPNSEYTKIEVTEKSYDFVTFSNNSNKEITNFPKRSKSSKNKNSKTGKSVYWIFIGNVRKIQNPTISELL